MIFKRHKLVTYEGRKEKQKEKKDEATAVSHSQASLPKVKIVCQGQYMLVFSLGILRVLLKQR